MDGLLVAPEVKYTASKVQYFERLLQTTLMQEGAEPICTTHPYPTHEFLCYLVEQKQFLLHGSNKAAIPKFEPRRQTDYEGRMITAVFAAEDSIAPMFYAILDRSSYKGSIRNTFRQFTDDLRHSRNYYRFSIDTDSLAKGPWIDGTVYAFSREGFEPVIDEQGNPLLEWASPNPAQPKLRVRVTPNDFPFLANVQGHDDRLQILIVKFLSSFEELRKLDDGFAFRYGWSRVLGDDVVMLIEQCRNNVPPMRVDLVSEPNNGPIWLHLRGPTEIKDMLQHAIEQVRM